MKGIWTDIIICLTTGLVSGVISSGIVTIIYRKKDRKQDFVRRFMDDKQSYARYLELTRNTLTRCHIEKNYTPMIGFDDAEPIRSTFSKLSGQDTQLLHDIQSTLDHLNQLTDHGKPLTEAQYREFDSKLLKYQIAVLKFACPDAK